MKRTVVRIMVILLLGSCLNLNAETVQSQHQTIRMLVTAYCPCTKCCGPQACGKTSLGDDAFVEDGVAANPKLLKYRTKLQIPGVGVREVDDTGGSMRKDGRRGVYHIDVRFRDHQKALQFGRKWLDVEVLK